MPETLTNPWKTAVGRDCANLNTSLCRWLGERLTFMSKHTHGHPPKYTFDEWTHTLAKHGEALTTYASPTGDGSDDVNEYRNAQNAMFFVTRNLGDLWD